MSTHTPTAHTINPRDLKFVRESVTRWWANGDPIATAFYNGFSATFPHGERFFMDAVRHFRDQVSPELQQQIKGFLTQEAIHTREHVAFNRLVADHGYDMAEIDQKNKEELDLGREELPIVQLAVTMGLEHFTAILAHALLANPRHLEGAPKEIADLWRWHAMEEIEHKAVAYDTFMEAMKDVSPFERWRIRCLVMLRTTKDLIVFQRYAMAKLLEQDGIDMKRSRWATFKFFFLSPGLVREIALPYLSYFLPGFHPWKKDDRALLRAEETRLAAA